MEQLNKISEMKKISVKLDKADYRYLCVLLKEIKEAYDDNTTDGYLVRCLLGDMYNRYIKKVPNIKKSATAIFSVPEVMFFTGLIMGSIKQGLFDDGNVILVGSLLLTIEQQIECAIKEDKKVREVMI